MWISPQELAQLAGISRSATTKALARAKSRGTSWRGAALKVRHSSGRGGAGGVNYEVHVDSLPVYLQARWLAQQSAPAAQLTNGSAAPGASSEEDHAQRPWTQAEREARHAAFTRLPTPLQVAARKKLEALHELRLLEDAGATAAERYAEVASKAGVARATLYQWVGLCRGLDPGDWMVALAPGHPGSRESAAIDRDAFDWIKSEYFSLTKPALAPIYRRALRNARSLGCELPSYHTINRAIKAIPRMLHVKLREGAEALERSFPTQQRIYGQIELHEEWCSDGHQGDLWVRWEDGTPPSRPIIVAWIDLRSRVVLGHVVARVESADSVRIAFKRSLELAHAIPRAVLLDNSRAFAGKMMSGGSLTRYRFKVKDDELPGIFSLLGCKVNWAPPRSGRSKPIEPFWRVLSHLDKQFSGAYCGNKPEARPEDCDPAKAVPIAKYRAALEETLRDYNEKPHRGDAMDGRSPRAVYEALLPNTIVRQPTREQIRLCTLAAEKVRLDPRDQSVRLLGNRYWAEKLASLAPGVEYVVRFNPEDATEPVSVYRGEEFICEAPLVARGGFRDQVAAKEHQRLHLRLNKLVAEQQAAMGDMRKARSWMVPAATEPKNAPDSGAGALPMPKIATPLRPLVDYQIKPEEPKRVSAEEVRKAAALGLLMQRKSGTGK